jgi:hypothetical protein
VCFFTSIFLEYQRNHCYVPWHRTYGRHWLARVTKAYPSNNQLI